MLCKHQKYTLKKTHLNTQNTEKNKYLNEIGKPAARQATHANENIIQDKHNKLAIHIEYTQYTTPFIKT